MDWTQLIPWGISLLMLIITAVAFVKGSKKDMKAEFAEESNHLHKIEQNMTQIGTKMDVLQHTVDEMRQEIKQMNDGLHKLEVRVQGIEKDQATMWRRIDEIRGKVEHYHEGN